MTSIRPLALTLAVLLVPGALFAQSTNAAITGQVADPSKAVITEAKVTAINDNTNIRYGGATNKSGTYLVPFLPPGEYRVQVEKLGFKTIVKPNVILHVQDTVELNFEMAVGSVSESMTVAGGAPLVNTESAAVSTVIDRDFVESLPLNGRSFNTLLQLTPGVVIAPSASNSPGQFSIAGQRTDANNLTVDGVSANFGVSQLSDNGSAGVGGAQAFSVLGGTSSLVSVDALQEFRIETSSFAPEFGRTPGGQVILTTRSGTNDFHGGAFDYFRNTVMDANDWFANYAGLPRAAEHHNDFGGFLGGPIWKDKTFFFFSYEGARLQLPLTAVTQVPSEYARTQASASIAPFLNLYSLPNGQPVSPTAYTAPLTASFSDQATLNATSIRIDHAFNGRFSVFGRYNYAPSHIVQRTGGLSNLNTVAVNTQTLTIGLNMFISNNTSNSLRANYSQQNSNNISALDSFGGAVPPDPSLLVGSLSAANTFVLFLPLDGTALNTVGPQARNRGRQLNFVDDFSATVGRHRLKFGGDYRAIFLDTTPNQHNLAYQPTSIESLVTTGTVSSFGAGTTLPAQLLTPSLSLYAQDSFQLGQRLTITYGLRWELNPAPSARGATTLASWTNVNTPSEISLAPSGTPLWSTTYGNVAPRFGLAYSLSKKGDFVLRAGVGLFYDTGVGSAGSLAGYFPNNAFQRFSGVPVPVANISNYVPVISLLPPYPFAEGFTPHLKLPRSYQWNVALEKSFAARQVISVTYLGQAGRDLFRQEALFQPNDNFSSEFLLTQNDARSNYDALQLQYRRPLLSGLQTLLSYTWSHSLDNASNDTVAGLSNTIISAASDYASSDFDIRHSFSGALTYAVPSPVKTGPLLLLMKDWFVDAVIVARSGLPFNASIYSTSPDPGGFVTSRPDRVAGQPLYLYGAQCIAVNGPPCAGGKGLNPAAFSFPLTVRQGTEGRNDIPGFGLTQIDLSVSRKFAFTERLNLQFRADAFNLFNHPNLANPLAFPEFGGAFLQSMSMLNKGLGTGLTPLFQVGGPRSLQLSLKLNF
jgi:hypothetical protein